MTPFASHRMIQILSTITPTDLRTFCLLVVLPVGLLIRLTIIYGLFRIWWRMRPLPPTPRTLASSALPAYMTPDYQRWRKSWNQ